eukprot:11135609-Ditylum_brightwellii.AAC.1
MPTALVRLAGEAAPPEPAQAAAVPQSSPAPPRDSEAAMHISAAQVESRVSSAVQAVLGRRVAADEPLMEAGLDSLAATQLQRSLSEATGAQLPATLMFDYPS